MGDRALLLGVRLGGQNDVGVAARLVAEHRDRDDEVRGAECPLPALRVGQVADGVGLPEDQARQLAGLQGVLDLLGAPALGRLGEAWPDARGGSRPRSGPGVGSRRHLDTAVAPNLVGEGEDRAGTAIGLR